MICQVKAMSRKKKLLLCVLNSKYIHSSLAPWCIFTSVKAQCGNDLELSVLEGTINEKDEDVHSRIIAEKADIVSFSCYIWNIEKTLRLCKKLKEENENLTLVLGGPEVAYNQKEILEKYSFIDFVFSGEGERVIPDFLKNFEKGEWDKADGVSFRRDGKIHISFASESEVSDYPSPYCEEYFASLKGRIAYIESSRGCPFSCAFCLSGRCGKVRFFPLERVKNEMLLLCNAGARTIKFVDRTFNCNLKRAKEILLFIKENYGVEIPEGVCFHFEIAADIADDEFISLALSMPDGSVQFEAGIQSFNENTLSVIGRKTDSKRVEKNLEKLIGTGNCHIHIDLIAGLPEENYESFIDGFNRAYKLKADMLQLGFLKILHGSPMGENREKYPCVYSEKAPYEVISTPWISEEELNKLHIAENELERLYNSSRFKRTLSYVLEKSGLFPYDLFYSFGVYLKEKGKEGSVPLHEYICFAYDFFSSLNGIDKKALRDKMLYDRVATDNTGIIPERLKVKDPLLKKARQTVNEISPLKKGVNRTVAILYSENKIIWCDYEKKNRVTGEYSVKEIR